MKSDSTTSATGIFQTADFVAAGAAPWPSGSDRTPVGRARGMDDLAHALEQAAQWLARAGLAWRERPDDCASGHHTAWPASAGVARGGGVRQLQLQTAGDGAQADAPTGSRCGCGTSAATMRPAKRQRDQRKLVTVLFTDIVGSTHYAETLGDAQWHRLLKRHRTIVRRKLTAFHGLEIEVPGDGFLATFDSPTNAVLCAMAIRSALRPMGLEIRAGLHAGECTVTAGRLVGIAVHVAARVVRSAEAGQILVSSTVKDLAFGSELRFSAETVHALKGLTESWRLFALRDDPALREPANGQVSTLHPTGVQRVRQALN